MERYRAKYLLGRTQILSTSRKGQPIHKTMTTKMHEITNSSQVVGIGYNTQDKQMFVRFKTGPLYQYDDVSVDEYESILNEKDSIGVKLRKVVKEKAYHKVIEEVATEVKATTPSVPTNNF